MNKVFQIGAFCFQVISKDDIPIPANFLLFEVSQEMEPEYTYHLLAKEQFPARHVI